MGLQGASHRNLGTENAAHITTLSLRRAQICIQQQSFEKDALKFFSGLWRPSWLARLISIASPTPPPCSSFGTTEHWALYPCEAPTTQLSTAELKAQTSPTPSLNSLGEH